MSDFDASRMAERLRVIRREAVLLTDVRDRLSEGRVIDQARVESLTNTGAGRDMLESFASKFARFQDMLIDKLLRDVLNAAGELTMTAIDNLNNAERLGWVTSANDWVGIRSLRNMLVHEYVEDSSELSRNLEKARVFTDEMLLTCDRITRYAQERLGITVDG